MQKISLPEPETAPDGRQMVRFDFAPIRIGLGGNDVSAFYPPLLLLACAVYFANNNRRVLGDYFQNEEEYEKTHDVRVVGQIGLRFATKFAGKAGVYNDASPEERDEREESFMTLVRSCVNRNGSTMAVTSEFASRSAQSEEKTELPDPSSGEINNDCKDTKQTSWWKVRYEMQPYDEFLPLSFLLEGTASNGSRVRLYGPVRSVKIEADRDISRGATSSNEPVQWKMYLELQDTNWAQEGGISGSPFRFVCSQQEEKCVFSALVDSQGKAHPVFVSEFRLQLRNKPVQRNTNVLDALLTSKSWGDVYYTFKLHPSRDLLLSYMVRGLPLIDSTIVYTEEESKLVLGGATGSTQLPLEVHIRSPEPLNDAGDKFLALPVLRVMLRYVSKAVPEPGLMDPQPASVQSMQLLLPGNRVLTQDPNTKTIWTVNDSTLHKTTSIDLLLLNKTPVFGGKDRNPGMSGGAKEPRVGGELWFEDFPGVRQGFTMVSLDKRRQDYIRGNIEKPEKHSFGEMLVGTGAPSRAWDDIRVNGSDDVLARPPTLKEVFIGQRGEPHQNRVIVVMVGGFAALMAGWKLADGALINNVGMLPYFVIILSALSAFVLALAEYLDRLPVELRPYEPVLYITACGGLMIAMALNLLASKFVPETSAAFVVSVGMAMVGCMGVMALETRSPFALPPSVMYLKLALLMVIASGLGVAAIELNKLRSKAVERTVPLPGTIMEVPDLAHSVAFGTVILIVLSVGVMEWRAPSDGCLYHEAQARKAQQAMDNATDEGAKNYFASKRDAAAYEGAVCKAKSPLGLSDFKWLSDERYVMFVPMLIAAIPALLWLAAPFVGVLIANFDPSRVSEETDAEMVRMEDGRGSRNAWVLKSLAGLALTCVGGFALLSKSTGKDPYCSHLRTMEVKNRDLTRQNPIEYAGPSSESDRMTLVHRSEWRFECQPLESLGTWLVGGGALLVALLSALAPARKRFVPSRSSALGTLARMVLFVAISGFLVWYYDEGNRTRIRNWLL